MTDRIDCPSVLIINGAPGYSIGPGVAGRETVVPGGAVGMEPGFSDVK